MNPEIEKSYGMPLKKAGAKYTRKELRGLGWTNAMIDTLPACMAKKSKDVYYRASDVATSLESNPKFVEHLINEAADKQSKSHLRDIPAKRRAELAKALGSILQPAFETAAIASEVKPIAETWHNLFMAALLAPQPSKDSMYEVVRGSLPC